MVCWDNWDYKEQFAESAKLEEAIQENLTRFNNVNSPRKKTELDLADCEVKIGARRQEL